VPGLALLEVERVLLPGSEAPTLLHALVGDEATAESEGFRRWQAAHETYRRLYLAGDFAAAGEQALLARRLSDNRHRPLYDYYRRRCTLLADQPPAADWDGVTVSHEK